MKYRQRPRITLEIAALAMVLSTPLLTSGEDSDRVIEEIIVTATRTETTLQDTSIAVSAFDSAMMDDMNLNSAMDYEALVPSLSIQLSPNRTSIRGVGRFDNSLGVAPGVAMYLDGAYLQENTALGQEPMNTERVEIMRGPQGTLFGRNTTGGATNIITKRPTHDLFFETRISTGNFNRHTAKMLLSGPLTDGLRAKIFVNTWRGDDLKDNLSDNDIGYSGYDVEMQVDWDVTDRLSVWLRAETYRPKSDVGGGTNLTPYDSVNVCRSALSCGDNLGTGTSAYSQTLLGIENNVDPWKTDINSIGETGNSQQLGVTTHIDYEFDRATLKYIGHSQTYDWYWDGTDFDGTSHPTKGSQLDIGQDQDLYTHEITLASTDASPLQYIVGAYYMDDENYQPYNIYDLGFNTHMATVLNPGVLTSAVPFAPSSIVGENPGLIYYYQDGLFENQNWSVFGEVNYAFNDRWALTLGARYSRDDLKGTEQQLVYGSTTVYWPTDWVTNPFYGSCPAWGIAAEDCIAAGAVSFGPDPATRTKSKEYTDTSGRIIIDYTPDDNNLFWFTFSNAFKVGGIRLGSMQGVDDSSDPYFDGEEVNMLELGWKGSIGNALNLEVILFDYDYQDMQQMVDYLTPFGITLSDVVNIDTEMYGFEFAGQWLATSNLMVYLTYSYNHAEFDEHLMVKESTIENRCDNIDAAGNCWLDLHGNRLDITPEQKLAVSAMYTWYGSFGEIALGGTWSRIGDRYFDIYNTPETRGDTYRRFDLNLSWRDIAGHWKVEAAVKNGTDEFWCNTRGVGDAPDNAIGGGAFPYTKYLRYSCNPANPRLYTLELQYNL